MKRRDITLGEMQDECIRIGGICVGIKNITEDCKYLAVCPYQSAKRKMCALNLTDPTRFTEAQMAFWKQWIAWGARYATENKEFPHIIEFMRDGGMSVGKVFHYNMLTGVSLDEGEVLDLAELLGKDGSNAG